MQTLQSYVLKKLHRMIPNELEVFTVPQRDDRGTIFVITQDMENLLQIDYRFTNHSGDLDIKGAGENITKKVDLQEAKTIAVLFVRLEGVINEMKETLGIG